MTGWIRQFVSSLSLTVFRGRGSLVLKVTDSWPACHEFKCSAAEDPQCRGGAMHVKSVEAQMSSRWWAVYTRAFGDGPRNFEPWSSDVDDT
ncbi:hypothetical protein TNCV_4058751 [Trichonephila clavipes]|nr:hypothetical protein TNCV_4058751 [Trichonephila clavipes]